MTTPRSCDTFVALPPATAKGFVVFGKNADRPCAEVQEVVHVPAKDHSPGSKLQCTYIEIDQVAHTHAVVLSKPAWMWGAEMGANEHGVCIGNEAVWTKLNGPEDTEEKLLGMDLLRLALERAESSKIAMETITKLIAEYGQGGPCSDEPSKDKWAYHNSFLIVDSKEAWVLEAVGNSVWAAEQITSGVRNISNELTIGTNMTLTSENIKAVAEEKGLWKPADGDFNFAKVFSDSYTDPDLGSADRPCSRQQWGVKLLTEFSKEGKFEVDDMFKILRHEESGICMDGAFVSAGSQVSVLPSGDTPGCHWLTATPNPQRSLFKPFLFCEGCTLGTNTQSTNYGDKDPAKIKPRFQSMVDREHALYKAHRHFRGLLDKGEDIGKETAATLAEMEKNCIADMGDIIDKFDKKNCTKVANIFEHMSNLEINFYKMAGFKET